MKKLFEKLFLASLFFILVGCTEEALFNNGDSEIPLISSTSSSVVSINDISRLMEALESKTRSENDSIFPITCITDENNDTLLYAVDKTEGGWILFSSDTRVPPVTGESNHGSFLEAISNEARKAWIDGISEDMRHIRNSPDHLLNFSKNQITENQHFWNSISNREYAMQYLRQNEITRIKPIDPSLIIYERFGHYELANTSMVNEDSICVERLTKTNWHQDYPFNVYCPYKSTGYSHAPTGCVAIAGAQMLCFLATEKKYPINAPSKAYVNWKVGDKTKDWEQYDFNNWIWEQMIKSEYVSAPLIAYVARKANIEFYDYGGKGYIRELVGSVFKPYGISCSYRTFDADIVEKSILNGMPVILRAEGITKNGENVGGHAFIADKFKRTRSKRIDTFRWVYDSMPKNPDGSLMLLPNFPDKDEIIYLSEYLPMIGMNWGLGNESGENDEWYSATQKWVIKTDPEIDWKEDRAMIHGFLFE